MWQTTVSSLMVLAEEVLTTEHKTDISSWRFNKPEVMSAAANTLEQNSSALDSASNSKKTYCDELLQREVTKENLRLDFASAAGSYQTFANDTKSFVEASTVTREQAITFTLTEFASLGQEQRQEDDSVRKESDAKQDVYKGVLKELEQFGAVENPYTQLDDAKLSEIQATLMSSLQQRKEKFEAEQQRLVEDDEACKAFASAVDPVMKKINDSMSQLTSAKVGGA